MIITDEAVEVYKKINLLSAWNVKARWQVEKSLLVVECIPSELCFNWSWNEIKPLLNLPEKMVPSKAIEVRERDSIALIFYSSAENDYCKPRSENGDIYEFGKLTSEGFVEC